MPARRSNGMFAPINCSSGKWNVRRAVAIEHAGGAITFEQLNRRSNQIAGLLHARGAGPEEFTGVLLDRSPDTVAAVLAVLKAGGAFVMLPRDLPEARLTAMLREVRPSVVISHTRFAGKLEGGGCAVLCLDELEGEIARQSTGNVACAVTAENAAYAAFTSGSTGKPKAAVLTHGSLANHTQAVARVYGITAADRRLQFASTGSDMFISEVFTYLCGGATLVFCFDGGGQTMAEFLEAIATHRITIAGMPSSWWREWVAAGFIPDCLRAVIVGMERVDAAALAAFRRMGGDRPRVFNAYGPTETSPTATIYEAGSSGWESESLVPIGRAIANNRVEVCDQDGNALPDGVAGELYIEGAGVGRGYLNGPRWDGRFRTGDRGLSLPDGNLVFLGRGDRQVKIRGYRVELEEVEAALAEHPGVRQCAVVAEGEDGGGRQSLAAYVTAHRQPGPGAPDLRRHVAGRLPDYMIPAHFTILARMPMTASGKIDRLALARMTPSAAACEDVAEPATITEKRLARIWQDVLGTATVDTTANFFEAGGDSLGATQLMLRVRREFDVDFAFASFLRAPNIVQMALALDAGAAPDEKITRGTALAHGQKGTRIPLFCITSHAQDLYVFRNLMNHLDSAQPVFVLNVPVAEGERVPAVEELAARVCRSVRGLRAEGPYMLGGYCFGGIVAFEAGRQLMAEGAEVPLVAFFDTPAPGYPRLLGSRWMAAQIRSLRRGGRTVGENAGAAAARMYVPKAIDTDVAQFMAEDEAVSSRVLEDPRLGWRDLCGGRFQVYRIPGDHVSWLQEPHAREAAARLIEALARHDRAVAAMH